MSSSTSTSTDSSSDEEQEIEISFLNCRLCPGLKVRFTEREAHRMFHINQGDLDEGGQRLHRQGQAQVPVPTREQTEERNRSRSPRAPQPRGGGRRPEPLGPRPQRRQQRGRRLQRQGEAQAPVPREQTEERTRNSRSTRAVAAAVNNVQMEPGQNRNWNGDGHVDFERQVQENRGKGMKRNEGTSSDERPTKTARVDVEKEAQAQGWGQLIRPARFTIKVGHNKTQIVEEDGGTNVTDEVGTATGKTETGAVGANVYQDYRQPQQMETEESNSELEEESEDDSFPSDDCDFDDNETGKDASDSCDSSCQDGEDECNLSDLASDYEEDDNKADASSIDEAESERRPLNPMTVAEARPDQLDLRETYSTEGHITLDEKKIRWHLMEALPSLTSPELCSERMRVFTLNIIKIPRESFKAEIRNLFESLPEDSLEKRLGMLAVQCGNYKENDLVEILQLPKCLSDCTRADSFRTKDVELVGNPRKCANMVLKTSGYDSDSAKSAIALQHEKQNNESARHSLDNYEKIIYGNVPIKEDKLLEISNIEGLEDRAKEIIKLNVAGRTVTVYRSIDPRLGWQEKYRKINVNSNWIHPEIGGIGWDICCTLDWISSETFTFNVTGTQILFPMLVKDDDLAKKLVAGQIKKLPSSSSRSVAMAPKCLLKNGISCFPVLQKPGMLIYRCNSRYTYHCDITKLRLEMGAEIQL